MNLHQLRIFLTIARCGSFTRAAEELHLSQPALSLHIKELEDELGLVLLDRLGKRVQITWAGDLLEEYAHRIFALMREAEEAMNELKGLRRGRLVIGASTTPGTYLLPRVLGEFRRRFPGIELSLEIANTNQIEGQVLRNELDLGVVGGVVTEKGRLVIESYVLDELVLIVSPSHPFVKKGKVTLEALKDEPFIIREEGSASRKVMEKGLKEKGIEIKRPLELGNTEAIKRAVAEGLGISFVSRHTITHELKAGLLCKIKVDGLTLKRQLNVIYHKDKRLPHVARAFLDLLHAMTQK